MNPNEQLARQATLGILKLMAIKWAIIIVINRLARRAARSASP